MIRITVLRNAKREIIGFDSIGHAGYDVCGKDIVCSAASILIINTINAIEKFTKDKINYVNDESEGKLEFRFAGTPSKEADLLFSTMLLGLNDLVRDENYSKYIELTYEEV